jgi:hypothetical protein
MTVSSGSFATTPPLSMMPEIWSDKSCRCVSPTFLQRESPLLAEPTPTGDGRTITVRVPSPIRNTVHDYLILWSCDGTLDRIHHALYVECREQAEREASPTAAIIDSQSVKSAEKGGPASIRMAMMRARRLRAGSATFW